MAGFRNDFKDDAMAGAQQSQRYFALANCGNPAI